MPLRTGGGRQQDLEPRFRFGLFLGAIAGAQESAIGTSAGAVKARSIRRLVDREKWDSFLLDTLVGTPWSPKGQGDQDQEVPAHSMEPMETEEGLAAPELGPQIRRVYLKKADFERHGYTKGCAGCRINNVDVTEIYSPPRATSLCADYNLRPGEALDLTTTNSKGGALGLRRAPQEKGG